MVTAGLVNTALGNYAKKDGTDATNPSGWATSIGKGTIDGSSDAQLVTGETVKAKLAEYAKADASNLSPANKGKWAEALGTGAVAANDNNLVTGATVNTALATKLDASKANFNVSNGTTTTNVNLNAGAAPTVTINGSDTIDVALTDKSFSISAKKVDNRTDLGNTANAGKLATAGSVKDYVDNAMANAQISYKVGTATGNGTATKSFTFTAGTGLTATDKGNGGVEYAIDKATAIENANGNGDKIATAGQIADTLANYAKADGSNVKIKINSNNAGTAGMANDVALNTGLTFKTATGNSEGLTVSHDAQGNITYGLTADVKAKLDKIDSAVGVAYADTNLSNITVAGKKVVSSLVTATKAAATGGDENIADVSEVVGTDGKKTISIGVSKNAVTNVAKAAAKEAVILIDGTNTTVDDTASTTDVKKYKVNVAGNLKGITSLTNDTTGTNGTTVTIGNDGVTLNNKKISGLADGDITATSTEAVTGKQASCKNFGTSECSWWECSCW